MFEKQLPIEIECIIYNYLHNLYMKDIVKEINENLVIIQDDNKSSFYIGDLNRNKFSKLNIF